MPIKRKLTVSLEPEPMLQLQKEQPTAEEMRQLELVAQEKKRAEQEFQKAERLFKEADKKKNEILKQKEGIKSQIASQEKKVQVLEKKYASKLNKLDSNVDSLIASEEQAKKKLTDANENLVYAKNQYDAAQKELATATTALDAQLDLKNENTKALHQVDSDLANKSREIINLTEEQKNTDAKIEELQNKITQKDLPYELMLARASLVTRLNTKTNLLGREASRLDLNDEEYEEYETLEKQVKAIEDEELQMQTDLQSLQGRKEICAQRIPQLNDELHTLQEKKLDIVEAGEKLNANVAEKKSALTAAKREAEFQRKKYSSVVEHANEPNDNLKKITKSVDSLQSEIVKTSRSGNKAVHDTKATISKLQKQEEGLSQKFEEQNNAVNESVGKLNTAANAVVNANDNITRERQIIRDGMLARAEGRNEAVNPAPVQQQVVQPVPVQPNQPAPVQGQVNQPAPVQGQVNQAAPVQGQVNQPVPVQGQANQPVPVQGQVNQPAPVQGQVNQPVPGVVPAPGQVPPANPMLAAVQPNAQAVAQPAANDAGVIRTYTTQAGNTIKETQTCLSVDSTIVRQVNGLESHQDDAMAIIILGVKKGLGQSALKPLTIETDDPAMLEAALLTAKALNINPAYINIRTNCPNMTANQVYSSTSPSSVRLLGAIRNNLEPEKNTLKASKTKVQPQQQQQLAPHP